MFSRENISPVWSLTFCGKPDQDPFNALPMYPVLPIRNAAAAQTIPLLPIPFYEMHFSHHSTGLDLELHQTAATHKDTHTFTDPRALACITKPLMWLLTFPHAFAAHFSPSLGSFAYIYLCEPSEWPHYLWK